MVLGLSLLHPTGGAAAESLPFRPDFSTPEATALTYCRAQNLEDGRVELVRSCFEDNGITLPASMLERFSVMCRVAESKILHVPPKAEQDPFNPEPFENGDASLVMEQWDPAAPEKGIFKQWLVLRNLDGAWKIIYWGDAYDADNPPDDIMVCTKQRWWGLPEFASPANVVCSFALELEENYPERLPRFMAAGVSVPADLNTDWMSAEVAAIRPESLSGNATAAAPLPEEAEVDLDVYGSLPGGDLGESRYRFFVRRTGDEWRIARIEYLGPQTGGTGK